MPETIDIDADPFLKLLTDALRAGPGSPDWHQAVSRLRSGGERNLDEYNMLIAARERLESGRGYREIRPGPAFTRKVMDGIDAEPPPGRRALPTANLIAILGAAVVLVVLASVGFWLLHGPPAANPGEDLSNAYFGTTVADATFNAPLPPAWRTLGPAPLDPARGLRPTTLPATTASSADYDGGGVVLTNGIPADQAFAVEASFRIQHVTDDVIPELFVTDQPDFDADRATSAHELVWLVREGHAKVVLPDQQFAGSSEKVTDGQSLTVRAIIGQNTAQLVSGRHTIWSGPSQLAGDRPRYVGIRVLRRGNEKKDRDAVIVQSVKVMQR
ncbi:MAG TPA: hypothetical protein VLI90_01260 [Tepidisphaeraceae bacterium]|nr:hypothetical protein [Tepidisphaeraceae bacterium]